MTDIRTTITIRKELHSGMKSRYRELGFSKMGDLINEAVSEYLQRRRTAEKLSAMERAASSESYVRLVKEIGQDFRQVDGEGLGPEY